MSSDWRGSESILLDRAAVFGAGTKSREIKSTEFHLSIYNSERNRLTLRTFGKQESQLPVLISSRAKSQFRSQLALVRLITVNSPITAWSPKKEYPQLWDLWQEMHPLVKVAQRVIWECEEEKLNHPLCCILPILGFCCLISDLKKLCKGTGSGCIWLPKIPWCPNEAEFCCYGVYSSASSMLVYLKIEVITSSRIKKYTKTGGWACIWESFGHSGNVLNTWAFTLQSE